MSVFIWTPTNQYRTPSDVEQDTESIFDYDECPRCGESSLIDFDHSVACLNCTYILAMHN